MFTVDEDLGEDAVTPRTPSSLPSTEMPEQLGGGGSSAQKQGGSRMAPSLFPSLALAFQRSQSDLEKKEKPLSKKRGGGFIKPMST